MSCLSNCWAASAACLLRCDIQTNMPNLTDQYVYIYIYVHTYIQSFGSTNVSSWLASQQQPRFPAPTGSGWAKLRVTADWRKHYLPSKRRTKESRMQQDVSTVKTGVHCSLCWSDLLSCSATVLLLLKMHRPLPRCENLNHSSHLSMSHPSSAKLELSTRP